MAREIPIYDVSKQDAAVDRDMAMLSSQGAEYLVFKPDTEYCLAILPPVKGMEAPWILNSIWRNIPNNPGVESKRRLYTLPRLRPKHSSLWSNNALDNPAVAEAFVEQQFSWDPTTREDPFSEAFANGKIHQKDIGMEITFSAVVMATRPRKKNHKLIGWTRTADEMLTPMLVTQSSNPFISALLAAYQKYREQKRDAVSSPFDLKNCTFFTIFREGEKTDTKWHWDLDLDTLVRPHTFSETQIEAFVGAISKTGPCYVPGKVARTFISPERVRAIRSGDVEGSKITADRLSATESGESSWDVDGEGAATSPAGDRALREDSRVEVAKPGCFGVAQEFDLASVTCQRCRFRDACQTEIAKAPAPVAAPVVAQPSEEEIERIIAQRMAAKAAEATAPAPAPTPAPTPEPSPAPAAEPAPVAAKAPEAAPAVDVSDELSEFEKALNG